MGLEIFERLPLRPIVRIVLEVTPPVAVVLPIDTVRQFHGVQHEPQAGIHASFTRRTLIFRAPPQLSRSLPRLTMQRFSHRARIPRRHAKECQGWAIGGPSALFPVA